MSRKSYYFAAAVFALVVLLGFGFAFSDTDPGNKGNSINWYSYEEGIEKIKKSNNKGYLHFYTDWCGYCRQMDNETFSDKDVISNLNDNFISIKINAEDEPGIARQYGADRFPFNSFIDGKEEPIGNQPGFISPDVMVHILNYVATDDYKNMQFDEFMEKQRQ